MLNHQLSLKYLLCYITVLILLWLTMSANLAHANEKRSVLYSKANGPMNDEVSSDSSPANYLLKKEINFAINETSLALALKQFSQQTNTQIFYRHSLVINKSSQAINGKYTIKAALEQLLGSFLNSQLNPPLNPRLNPCSVDNHTSPPFEKTYGPPPNETFFNWLKEQAGEGEGCTHINILTCSHTPYHQTIIPSCPHQHTMTV